MEKHGITLKEQLLRKGRRWRGVEETCLLTLDTSYHRLHTGHTRWITRTIIHIFITILCSATRSCGFQITGSRFWGYRLRLLFPSPAVWKTSRLYLKVRRELLNTCCFLLERASKTIWTPTFRRSKAGATFYAKMWIGEIGTSVFRYPDIFFFSVVTYCSTN